MSPRPPRFGLVLLPLVITALLGGAGAGLLVVYFRGLPSLEEVQGHRASTVTKIFAADGSTLIGEFFREKRLLVRLDEIPAEVINAVIATEDRKFYEHPGIDIHRIAGAALRDIRAGAAKQGGSTITQQLARNLFLTHDRVWSRKIRELLLALKLERVYSKDEILARYLNQIYFGHGAYGIEAASQRFFSKSVAELTLDEATLLAGLPGNPAKFSPIHHLDAALGRRQTVLRSMVDFGVLDPTVAASAAATEVQLVPSPRHRNQAPYFIEWVRRQVEPIVGSEMLHEGGLRIYTTLDPRLQKAAEDVVESGLVAQEERAQYSIIRANVPDSIEIVTTTPYVQGALLALDPPTGAVRAMVGGRDFQDSQFNRATQARRQVGSLFKPIVVTQAFLENRTPADIVVDGPIVMDTGAEDLWQPKNYDQKFHGPITIRTGLMKSHNLMAIRLALDLGMEPIVDLAQRLGIKSPLPAVPALAIGAGDITLWEMSRAYSTYANSGVLVEPFGILRVLDASGRILLENTPTRREVLPEAVSFLVTSTMRSVLDEGTGIAARRLGFSRPAAGKTGTTNNYIDAWFIGFTPELVTGVWVGFDGRDSLGRRQSGSVVALPIWTQFMRRATQGTPVGEFAVPDGIVSAEICNHSGQLMGSNCLESRAEFFARGSQPEHYCDHPLADPDGSSTPGSSVGLEF